MLRIESTKNQRIKDWTALHAGKGRRAAGCFWAEGEHLVEEAARSGIEILELIQRDGSMAPYAAAESARERISVSEAVMRAACETDAPPGLAAVCRTPKAPVESIPGRALILEAVQDPGNVGALLRVADGVGCDAVVLGEGCADPWGGKTLRAAQGSTFHVQIFEGADVAAWCARLRGAGVTVVAAAQGSGVRPLEGAGPLERFALLMGNEGAGITPASREAADFAIEIPIFGRAESLNVAVAAGIIAYRLRGV